MPCRVIPCSFLAACLVFAVGAVWLPGEVASRHQAEAEPEPATSDANLIASECGFFITFRPADFLADELAKAVLQNLPKAIEEELHVPTSGMARLTVATLRQGSVQIVRTKKPYDAEGLQKGFARPRFRSTTKFRDKDGAKAEPRDPVVEEKKAGGKRIYYSGELNAWTWGWCPIDKTTFMAGNVAAIQALLETKGKPSAEMTDALALGSKHSLVMAMDGRRLRAMFRQQREDRERERREWQKKREERFKDAPRDIERGKDKGFSRGEKSSPREVFVSAQLRAAAEDKPKADEDDVDAMFDSLGAGAILLPYKPLLGAKFGLLTLDVGKTDTLTARIDFADKSGMDDGETAMKTLLYVGRQLAVMLPKLDGDFRGMKPLGDSVRKAFEAAKVERNGTTLRAAITMTPDAGLAKKVREGIEEEGKRREKMYGGRDKTRIVEKDKSIRRPVDKE